MHGIAKRFGAVEALRGVDLELRHDEVLGLVGDNAAGKSTLMKVLTGVHQPDAGSIAIDGQPVHFRDPHDSRALGIEMIDLALPRPSTSGRSRSARTSRRTRQTSRSWASGIR